MQKEIKLNGLKITVLSITVLVLTTVIIIRNLSLNTNKLEINYDKASENIISLTMNEKEKTLDCVLNTMCLNASSDVRLAIDIDNIWLTNGNLELDSFKIDKDIGYVKYSKGNNENREIVLASTVENVNTSDLKFKNLRFRENHSDNQNKLAGNSLYDTYLILSETTENSNIQYNSLETEFEETENTIERIEYSEKSTDTKFNFDGLGSVGFDFGMETVISYSNTDKIIKIANGENLVDLMHISCINNNCIEYEASEFKSTSDERLFTSIRDSVDNDDNYETFALLGDNNLYVIQCKEEYKEMVLEKLNSDLGIKTDNLIAT